MSQVIKKSTTNYKSLIISILIILNPIYIVDLYSQNKITGNILDYEDNTPVIAKITNQATRKSTNTHSDGTYQMLVPNENVNILFSSIGYENFVLSIKTLTQDTLVNIYLKKKESRLQEIIVTSDKFNKVYSSQMGAISIDQKEIKSIPTVFGEADIVKALQTQAGVSSGIEGFAGMYVRGGNNDENLLMIDGNPLYQVNHFGGLFSSFNVEAINSVDFYKSAFPARYGGRLSSVMNVHTKNGNFTETHGAFSIGLTSGNFNIETPIIKDKLSLNFSVRRSWLELLTIPALAIINNKDKDSGKKTIGSYSFTDINTKLNYKANNKNDLYFTVYYGSDYLKIGEEEFSVDSENTFNKKDINRLRWGNLLLASGWIHKFNRKFKVENVLSYTHYKSKLKDSSFEKWGYKDSDDFESKDMQKQRENGINDIAFRSVFSYYPNDKHIINVGFNYINHKYLPEKIKEKNSLKLEPDTVYSNSKIQAHEFSLFIEDDWAISSFLRINAGLRYSNFTISEKTYHTLEPRLSSRALISEKISLKASYARMTQFVQQISDSYISLPTDFWMPVSKQFKPLTSDQISAGIYYNHSKEYSTSVEVYHKWMNNLLEYKDGYSYLPVNINWDAKLTDGKGTAYGVDIALDKKEGKLKGSIGYGLMWTDRHFAEINKGRHFPSKYDNRHKINIIGSYILKKNVELNFSWMYMTGNKVTLSLENYQDLPTAGFPSDITPTYPYPDGWGIDYYDSKNNVRLPAYHRLDLGLNIYRPKKNNRMAIWNISIYNAYSKMNPIVIQKETKNAHCDEDHDHSAELNTKFRSLSIFPIIPSISYTYKF